LPAIYPAPRQGGIIVAVRDFHCQAVHVLDADGEWSLARVVYAGNWDGKGDGNSRFS
jgi:hypothetical protein